MKVNVMLFARARDLAQADRLTVDLAKHATIASLRTALCSRFPAEFLASCAMAVGDEFVESDIPLSDGAVVALLPPVSGGEA